MKKGGGENAIVRHTQRNKKLFVRERLRLLLDPGHFLELSPLAGLELPYGDVPAGGCLTGNKKGAGIKFMGYLSAFLAKNSTGFIQFLFPTGKSSATALLL